MRVFPSCFRTLLSYLPGISSGETDGAVATSGEAEFYSRWETFGRGLGLRATSPVSPRGLRLYFSLVRSSGE
jgi:hypothetical protein